MEDMCKQAVGAMKHSGGERTLMTAIFRSSMCSTSLV
jgi:hypothetical protein